MNSSWLGHNCKGKIRRILYGSLKSADDVGRLNFDTRAKLGYNVSQWAPLLSHDYRHYEKKKGGIRIASHLHYSLRKEIFVYVGEMISDADIHCMGDQRIL